MERLTPEETLAHLRDCLDGGRDTVLVDLATGTLLGLDPYTGEVRQVDADADAIYGWTLAEQSLHDVAMTGLAVGRVDAGDDWFAANALEFPTQGTWLVDPSPIDVEREFVQSHVSRFVGFLGEDPRIRERAIEGLDAVATEYVVMDVRPSVVESYATLEDELARPEADLVARAAAQDMRDALADGAFPSFEACLDQAVADQMGSVTEERHVPAGLHGR